MTWASVLKGTGSKFVLVIIKTINNNNSVNQKVFIFARVGLQRKLSTEEVMLLICGVGEDSWESLGLQEDPTSPS